MLGSSVPLFHTESYSVSTMNDDFYVNINDVAKAKGLTSNRAIRLEINKSNSKYVARKVKVNGGESYEILYSTLEADVQEILKQTYSGTTALVPADYQPPNFESESLPHLCDRIYKSYKFERYNTEDIRIILKELSELEFTDDGVEYLATRANQFRQIMKLVNKIENLANTNQITVLDETTLKGLLNERPNLKIMP